MVVNLGRLWARGYSSLGCRTLSFISSMDNSLHLLTPTPHSSPLPRHSFPLVGHPLPGSLCICQHCVFTAGDIYQEVEWKCWCACCIRVITPLTEAVSSARAGPLFLSLSLVQSGPVLWVIGRWVEARVDPMALVEK